MLREEIWLQDIVQSIDDVSRFTGGTDAATFLTDEILQNAVLMKLIVIGEAATKISNETRGRYPEIEWKLIVGFRNIAVHTYFSVKWNVVWETITEDLQILRKAVILLLETEYPDFELRNKR